MSSPPAPDAKTEDTDKVKPFIGKKILRLPKGQEIVSKYITLPVADRSYYAMCGVLKEGMRVTVSVEDEQGQGVECSTQWGDNVRKSCPQSGSPKLGGGFVFAQVHNIQPDVPPENMVALWEAAQEFGRY